MEEIVAKIKELYDLLVKKTGRAEQRLIEVDQERQRQERVAGVQAQKNQDLSAREAAVSKIESVVEMDRKNTQLLVEIGDKQQKLSEERLAHNKRVIEQRDDNEAQKKNIQSQLAVIAEREKSLGDNFKQSLIKELLSKLKG